MDTRKQRRTTDLTWWLAVSMMTLAVLLVVIGIGVDSQVSGGPGTLFEVCLIVALVLFGLVSVYMTARYLSTRDS